MTGLKLVSISCFLIFHERVFNQLDKIPPQNKDPEVVFAKNVQEVNLTLVFSRKYIWPEHYFSVWSLGNPHKLLTANQFLVSTIFCTILNIFFFSLRFDLFSINAKEVNQVRNNAVCVVARCVFLFCCAHTMGCCNAFQHIFVN